MILWFERTKKMQEGSIHWCDQGLGWSCLILHMINIWKLAMETQWMVAMEGAEPFVNEGCTSRHISFASQKTRFDRKLSAP